MEKIVGKHWMMLVLFVWLVPLGIIAQTASIRGIVYEEESGEPAILANVFLLGTTYGASTDENGYFLITKIPAGDYTLITQYLGFDTIREQITLEANDIIDRRMYLEKSSVSLETVEVSADRIEQKTETRTSVVKITPKDIKQIPSVGGQADFAQYLQVVPGIIFTGDQGGQFYVRGGSPIQNKVMLDGMVIYNPFHSIGLFSVFETDLIRTADVYTGGYNAEYGTRISSIMDITYKDGNKRRWSGAFGASTFGARALLEGPLVKQKGPDKGSASIILSYKNSYLSQSSKIFYDYIDEDGLPFDFQDIYGKISLNAANGSKISFFGFGFSDDVTNYQSIANFGWDAYGGGTNFVVIPGKSTVLIEGTLAYSQYRSQINSETLSKQESYIGGFTMELDFTYFLGKNSLQYGIEMQGFRTEYIFENFLGFQNELIENTTQLGLYAQYKATVGKFIIEPGFRLQWYASLSNISPEPRLAVKYNATDWLRVKLAAGLYSQNFIAATSDRDVVNLFYGFISGPENLPQTFNGEELDHKLQKANHVILGTEWDVGRYLNINLEGYYKFFPQLTNVNRFKIYNEGTAPPGASDVETKDFILEQGHAYGIDLAFKFDRKNLYLWVVYSLGYTDRQYEDRTGDLITYNPHFDRRHNVNMILSYALGGKRQWDFSARWNLGSGFPFTQVQGFHEYLTFPGGINTDYPTENGQLGVIYGELFGGRLPYYHRLDLDVKYNLYLGANSRFVFDLSVINVYDRKNVFYVDLITGDVVYQLPIMPSFGITFYF
jgi:hypothetical protein